jgi:hypothetical protein
LGSLQDSLKQAVRDMAYRTSVDALRKRGVEHVNVLGLDRITALIDEAVHRSLKSRLVGIEREAVADATKAEFLRLLRSNEDLQRQKGELEQLKERAEEEIDTLRREIDGQQQALQLRLREAAAAQAGRYEGENAAIAARVAEVFTTLVQERGTPSLAEVQEKTLAVLLEVVTTERRSAEFARQALRDREIDNLQRRLHKLNDALAQTEHRLQQAAALKSIDQGISSVYRQAQGLRADEQNYARKRELMAEIFAANLRLQKGMA